MDKNALVSVFLRVLEYYQGIMFLTTNQIAQFDVAIPSRIHVSVQYDSLKKPQMEKIFTGFLQPLEDKGLIKDYNEILNWLKEDVYSIGFDGRQIRNIVTTALGLSRAEAQYGSGKAKLTKSHLKAVVNNSRSFKNDFIRGYDRYLRSQDDMIS
jgi:ATP-dependent Clp protease ATP-binding subunit ClpA